MDFETERRGVALDDILITGELDARGARTPDLLAENRALHDLVRQVAAEPERIFARLAEIALDLCDAGSAGISILETAPSGETVFRWRALAGRLKPLQGGTAPRDFSLCGVCLDERRPVLLSRPGRLLTYLNDAGVEIVEGLVVPLPGADGRQLGSIWVLSHDERRRFDAGDVQVMTRLADFTALGLKVVESIAEKDLLLREVDHRVANSLQLTSSLLRLQARRVEAPGARDQLERAAQRVVSIMQIHQRLAHGSAGQRVEMGAYLRGLCRDLARSVVLDQRDIRLNVRIEGEEIRVPFDRATHLGLLVNELVTNALKHGGSAATGHCAVDVLLEPRGDGILRLAVTDDGPGVPTGFDPADSPGLGMTVVKSMVAQLGGVLSIDRGSERTCFVVEFPGHPEA